MKKALLISITINLLSCFLSAQTQTCNVNQSSERLLANKKSLSSHAIQNRAITYVPVQFHLIADNNGLNAVKISAVLNMLCGINEFYSPLGIQFYIHNNFNIINSTEAAIDPHSNLGHTTFENSKIDQVLNIYIVQEIGGDMGLGYYLSPDLNYKNDYLIIQKSEAAKNKMTAIHNLGHYFSLLHTYNGWIPYDSIEYGNPVKVLDNLWLGQTIPIEFVDKSNCETAGDYLCDTPASYNFANGYWLGKGCLPFDNSIKDFHGDIVDPDESNIMDDFKSCSNYHFSNTQEDLIKTDLESRKNATDKYNLDCTYTPTLNIILNNIIPDNLDSGSVINNYGDIKLDWEDIPGATAYYVEIDGSKSFISTSLKTGFVTASEWTAPGLLKNKTYYWHVYPYNEYYTCAGFSKIFGFTTGQWVVSTNDIKELDSWKINPNPADENSIISIEVNTLKEFNAAIVLADITGKTVSTTNMKFSEGEQKVDISTNNLTPGMYVVQLKTETGISTQKLVIH